VSWATGALDEVRREVWRTARHAGATTTIRHRSRRIRLSSGDAKSLARARYALWKNPGNLTGRQEAKLAWIEKTHPYLYRAYLLKEGLRTAFKLKGEEGKHDHQTTHGTGRRATNDRRSGRDQLAVSRTYWLLVAPWPVVTVVLVEQAGCSRG
jgi:Transposase